MQKLLAIGVALLAACSFYAAGYVQVHHRDNQLNVPAQIKHNIAQGYDCWVEIDPVLHSREWLCK